MSQSSHDPSELRSYMYGPGDLGALAIFSGGFINYGYWPSDMDGTRPLTVDERTASQADLYREVAARLNITADARLLEVGCGKGAGAALVQQEWSASVIGLDLSGEQLARVANASHTAGPTFVQGSGTGLPLAASSLDGVYCVEAAQHFDDHRSFAVEARRVLRGGGRFVVAGFFAPGDKPHSELAELLETVGNGIDIVAPVDSFTGHAIDAGFVDVTAESIGARVWRGLDTWIAQTEYRDSWGRNWWHAYRQGWVDYYLIHATAPPS